MKAKLLKDVYVGVGEGWHPILEQLADSLQWDTDKNKYPRVVVDQIKEKFGDLRFYYHTEGCEDDPRKEYKEGVIAGKVRMAERICGMTCESCGAPGTTEGSIGWIKCLCKDCRKR